MAKKQHSFLKMPVSPKAILDSIGFTDKLMNKEITISVLVDVSLEQSFLTYIKKELKPREGNANIDIQPYFAASVTINSQSDLMILFANEAPETGRVLTEALQEQIPAVAVTLDPSKLQNIARCNYHEIDVQSIIGVASEDIFTSETYAHIFDELGNWIVRKMGDLRIIIARSLGFVREPFVNDVIRATSLQNAAIAAVSFIPGADMPLLTLNQTKMYLQIAAAYEAKIDNQRIKELALLLASAFGLRAIARRLVGLIPVFGWAMRGAVGYGATTAMGYAAKAYFEAGGSIAEVFTNKKYGKSE